MRLARYIDDIALRQQDSNVNGTFDTAWYHCTDTLFSTVAVLDDAANLVERVSYDAYGMARHHHAADLDGDGAVTQDDVNEMAGLGNFGVGDIDRSGTVDSKDQAIVNDSKPALPRGEISKTDNIVGYAGYLFNAEIHGAGMYTVRHRHYAPDLGRWLTRDPAGYVDGMNLYQYVVSDPVLLIDPRGLAPQLCAFAGIKGRGEANYVQAWLELGLGYKCSGTNIRSNIQVVHPFIRWTLQSEASRLASEHCEPLCADGERVSIQVLMIAPKTATLPPEDGCCDIEVTTIWSPRDSVPNPHTWTPERELWPQYGPSIPIYPINSPGHGVLDGLRHHDLNNFVNGECIPLFRTTDWVHKGRGNWLYPGTWIPFPRFGPVDPAFTIEDKIDTLMSSCADRAVVCHSQGCNIAMHWLAESCSRDGCCEN